MYDSLGDRMKYYESANTGRLIPLLPVMIRLDGVAFHTFTKGLERPYDKRLSNLMTNTMVHLVEVTNARLGYTQSDEITLILYSDNFTSQIYFDGKIAKLTSVLAAKASVYFNLYLNQAIPEKSDNLAYFDCRVWNVPNKVEAANTIIWRELDAVRNSIQMAAQSKFSHNELHGKSCNELQEMLFQKGINWNDYPTFFKRGTYAQRQKVIRPFTVEEIAKLPAKHEARSNPNLKVERTEIKIIDMPVMTKITNKEEVLFDGAIPKVLL